ncbi:MAG: hypothetical protein IJ649_06750, partial [Oscillospiraceae bacterium]|nr:hypothetical protein [Oscillospiraceae bacterium]
MKNIRKAFALLLVLAVVLSLTGCSPITITRAAKNMSSVKSLRADMALDLDLGMAMMEETSEIAAAVTGPVELDLANGKGHGDISVDVMGQALSILFYYEDLK